MTYRNSILGIGRAYGNIGDLENAEKYFEQYITNYPNQFKGYLQYGSILEKNGKPEKAKELYERAMEANPESAVAEFALANNLRSKGKLEEAVKYYEKGLEKDPEFQDGNGWFQLAKTYEQLGETEKMMKAYEELVKVRPDDAQAHYLLADTYLSQGMNVGSKSGGKDLSAEDRNKRIELYKKAIKHDEKAYELEPKSNQYKIHLVNSYIKLSEMYTNTNPKLHDEYAQKTIPILEQYIKENPGKQVGYSLIADSYFKLDQYQKSIDNAEKSLEIEENAYAHSILADVYYKLKNWPLAKKHYLQILDNPNYPYAKGRLEIVEKRLRGEY
jgi:tetratricopeptide (TPR) repeat protein